MTIKSDAQRRAVAKYNAKAYDRIFINVPKGDKEKIKAHADNIGESMNGFINRAIMEVTEMDNMHMAYQRGLLRHLNKINDAIENKDYDNVKVLIDELIDDTKKDINE